MDIPAELKKIEEAWASGLNTVEDLAHLKLVHSQATEGYDRHRATCLIELIESPLAVRNDGEIKRLLKHRNTRLWNKLLVPLNR